MSRFHYESLHVAMNELSNHDHSRFLTRTNRRVGRLATTEAGAAEKNVNKAVMQQRRHDTDDMAGGADDLLRR